MPVWLWCLGARAARAGGTTAAVEAVVACISTTARETAHIAITETRVLVVAGADGCTTAVGRGAARRLRVGAAATWTTEGTRVNKLRCLINLRREYKWRSWATNAIRMVDTSWFILHKGSTAVLYSQSTSEYCAVGCDVLRYANGIPSNL